MYRQTTVKVSTIENLVESVNLLEIYLLIAFQNIRLKWFHAFVHLFDTIDIFKSRDDVRSRSFFK